MSILRFFRKFFAVRSEQRFDNIQITNVVDGTTIKGHDEVKAYFEREEKLLEEHGSALIFEVFRINLQAGSLAELQGEKITEIKLSGGFVSGEDSVAAVKEKVRFLLTHNTQLILTIDETDRITLSFCGRPMQDETAFYADNFMLLPAWVQVFIHRCEYKEFVQLIARLMKNNQESLAPQRDHR
jgi:hypothetical protein